MSRRAIVTGGSRGIGRAIAQAIVTSGGRVMITGRDAGRVREAAQELGAAAGHADHAIGLAADVRDRASVDRVVAEAVHHFGRVDTLINNAGVGAFVDVASMSDEEWARVIDTNLTGVFYFSRAVIPEMMKTGG